MESAVVSAVRTEPFRKKRAVASLYCNDEYGLLLIKSSRGARLSPPPAPPRGRFLSVCSTPPFADR
jgi:hypothetical protein